MKRSTEKIIEKALGKSIEEIRNTPLCELPRKPNTIDEEFCRMLGIRKRSLTGKAPASKADERLAAL